MANPAYQVTRDFEARVAEYTGAPYAVAVDNQSNALWLCLMYEKEFCGLQPGSEIEIPKHTYVSVPCEIIYAGFKVKFLDSPKKLTGGYRLFPSRVIDAALAFTHNMYMPGTFTCLSFTGPYKHLKLGKGGMILTDSERAYKWLKRARFSGRNEVSYHEDNLDMLGRNCYMMPEIAARGLLLMNQFYAQDGTPLQNDPLTLPYPDLSQFKVYQQ